MEINETPNNVANANSAAGSLTGGTSLAETFDNFLTLLTTQLQNQDPLSPLDTNEFTDQLVQFTGVEQALATNDKLDELIALQGSNQLSATLDYIDKTVTVDSELLALQEGSATITYNLATNAENAAVFIVNSFGNTVRTISADPSAGHHEVVWDGLDQSGDQLADGVYSFFVSAVDQDNGQIEVTQATRGLVTAVRLENGQAILELGDLDVPADLVRGIGSASAG